jgi:putative SOS response-associated peptidase YedK
MGPAHWGLPGRPDRPAPRLQGHINTRAETIHTRPSFRDAFAHRRCVIPADGFYEWTGPKDHRLPIWFHPSQGIVAFAALFGEHVDPRSGEVQLRFSIVTTAANARVATAHDRMPVILAAPAIARWLAPAEPRELDDLRKLLVPASDDLLLATEVSSRANHVAHDDPACIVETPHPRQESLF